MTNAGDYKRRVVVQRRTQSRSATGAVVDSWSTHATRWAAIEPLSGGEGEHFRLTYPTVTHRVRMRYSSDLVTPKDRILWESRYLNVEAAFRADEGIEEIVALCREAV